jgi:hypothetical protein
MYLSRFVVMFISLHAVRSGAVDKLLREALHNALIYGGHPVMIALAPLAAGLTRFLYLSK